MRRRKSKRTESHPLVPQRTQQSSTEPLYEGSRRKKGRTKVGSKYVTSHRTKKRFQVEPFLLRVYATMHEVSSVVHVDWKVIVCLLLNGLRRVWGYLHVLCYINPFYLLFRRRDVFTLDSEGCVVFKPSVWESLKRRFRSEKSARNEILKWTQNTLPGYAIDNLSTCWMDGVAICALIETVSPGACASYDQLNPSNKISNWRLALKLAKKYFAIPQTLVSAEEIIDGGVQGQTKLFFLLAVIQWSVLLRRWRREVTVKSMFIDFTGVLLDQVSLKCTAKGCGLLVGLTGKRSKFEIDIPVTACLDISIHIIGPKRTFCNERITRLFYTKRTNSWFSCRHSRPIDKWKQLVAKVMTGKMTTAPYSFRRSSLVDFTQTPTRPQKIQFNYQCVARGRFLVTYVPEQVGSYTISIKWRCNHIAGSPFTAVVADEITTLNRLAVNKFKPDTISPMNTRPTEAPIQQRNNNRDGLIEEMPCDLQNDVNVSDTVPNEPRLKVNRLQRQATITRRRVIRRTITVAGSEIVIEASQPSVCLKLEQKCSHSYREQSGNSTNTDSTEISNRLLHETNIPSRHNTDSFAHSKLGSFQRSDTNRSCNSDISDYFMTSQPTISPSENKHSQFINDLTTRILQNAFDTIKRNYPSEFKATKRDKDSSQEDVAYLSQDRVSSQSRSVNVTLNNVSKSKTDDVISNESSEQAQQYLKAEENSVTKHTNIYRPMWSFDSNSGNNKQIQDGNLTKKIIEDLQSNSSASEFSEIESIAKSSISNDAVGNTLNEELLENSAVDLLDTHDKVSHNSETSVLAYGKCMEDKSYLKCLRSGSGNKSCSFISHIEPDKNTETYLYSDPEHQTPYMSQKISTTGYFDKNNKALNETIVKMVNAIENNRPVANSTVLDQDQVDDDVRKDNSASHTRRISMLSDCAKKQLSFGYITSNDSEFADTNGKHSLKAHATRTVSLSDIIYLNGKEQNLINNGTATDLSLVKNGFCGFSNGGNHCRSDSQTTSPSSRRGSLTRQKVIDIPRSLEDYSLNTEPSCYKQQKELTGDTYPLSKWTLPFTNCDNNGLSENQDCTLDEKIVNTLNHSQSENTHRKDSHRKTVAMVDSSTQVSYHEIKHETTAQKGLLRLRRHNLVTSSSQINSFLSNISNPRIPHDQPPRAINVEAAFKSTGKTKELVNSVLSSRNSKTNLLLPRERDNFKHTYSRQGTADSGIIDDHSISSNSTTSRNHQYMTANNTAENYDANQNRISLKASCENGKRRSTENTSSWSADNQTGEQVNQSAFTPHQFRRYLYSRQIMSSTSSSESLAAVHKKPRYRIRNKRKTPSGLKRAQQQYGSRTDTSFNSTDYQQDVPDREDYFYGNTRQSSDRANEQKKYISYQSISTQPSINSSHDMWTTTESEPELQHLYDIAGESQIVNNDSRFRSLPVDDRYSKEQNNASEQFSNTTKLEKCDEFNMDKYVAHNSVATARDSSFQSSVDTFDGFGVSADSRKLMLGDINSFMTISPLQETSDVIAEDSKPAAHESDIVGHEARDFPTQQHTQTSIDLVTQNLDYALNNKLRNTSRGSSDTVISSTNDGLQNPGFPIRKELPANLFCHSLGEHSDNGISSFKTRTKIEENNEYMDFPNYPKDNYGEEEEYHEPGTKRLRAFGSGLHYGQVGVTNNFQVQIENGGQGSLSVCVSGKRPHSVAETSIIYTGDNLYEVTYEVTHPGYFVISVKWSDQDIPNSPFLCKVTY